MGDALFEAVQRQLTQHGDITRVRSGATPSIKTRRWLKSTPTISETCGRCCSGAGTLKQIEFALVNRVQVAPTFIFFNADGEPVTRFDGPLKDSGEFLQLGRYVVEAAYETVPFRTYQLQHSIQ